MDFVCLAAGKGTRFASLDRYLQKCMYPVGPYPFMEYSLRNLPRDGEGEDRLTFVVGCHAEQIVSYFGDSYEGIPVRYVAQSEPLGTAHAVAVAQRAFGFTSPAVIWLGDLYVPARAFRDVLSHPCPNVLTLKLCLRERGDVVPENRNIVVETEGDRVVRCWKGGGDLYDVGLWKLGPGVLGRIGGSSTDEQRMLLNLQHLLEQGTEMHAVLTDQWIHLGATEPSLEENLREVVRRLQEETQPEHGK
ncbi:MAG: NTP transferase domain-containing protein [Spirochaetales bacterium]|nr:NTP transferase domain-containing protein [Spirochaetales bacterium]